MFFTFSEIQTLLRGWRENNHRRSDDVVEIWQMHLESNVNKLGKESESNIIFNIETLYFIIFCSFSEHVILEQVIFASLDCHLFDIAKKCIDILNIEFPASLRVKRYEAMKLEAMEKYVENVPFELLYYN